MIITKSQSSVFGLTDTLSGLRSDVDLSRSDLTTLLGDSTVEGSLDYRLAQVIGTAPDALDTLNEIAASLNNDPDLYGTLTTMMDTNITAAKDEIKGGATEEYDTLYEVEERLLVLDSTDATVAGSLAKVAADANTYSDSLFSNALQTANNLSDLADVATARTNLDVYSKAEVDSIAAPTLFQESVTVSGDSITLSYPPVNNIVLNFGVVRYTDDDGVVTDIPVVVDTTDDTNVTWTLQPDNSGDYDTQSVAIQYMK